MTSLFRKLSAVILITLLIGVSSVFASGKMEVRIGERVDLVGESKLPNPTYKWIIKKDKEILSAQNSRNFNYKFDIQGEYVINLTATSGSQIESTTLKVMTGERYDRPVITDDDGEIIVPTYEPSLDLVLTTLPERSFDGRIELIGDGRVYFLLAESTGSIIEYRIDKNIFVDSDGNGTANDDIDNSGDDSYLTGKPWQVEYSQDESVKIAAEVTLVSKSGKKVKEQVEIAFRADTIETDGDPVAILDILPSSDSEDGMVHLYDDPHTVGFYARRSEGKILEYRIDKNTFVDTDGDGKPENDIDNIDDISFKTGDIWETEYEKTDDQIIAQLIVVGEGGRGSRIQKGIVFGEKPVPPAPTLDTPEVAAAIQLTADKEFVVKGDPITFTVAGLQLAIDQYSFEWDFDGDGEMDKEVEGINTIEHLYDFPGVFEVKVQITDQEGNSAERTSEVVVKDTIVTKSDFTFEVAGNIVKFDNFSTASEKLAKKTLDYQWSFGDTDVEGYEEQKDQIGREDPIYTYNKAGKYVVTLMVTDADQVIDSKSAEIDISQDLAPPEEEVSAEELAKEEKEVKAPKEEGSLFVKLLKVFLYLVLIVIALVVMIVGGFLVFFKVQHPDLTFEELVDEFKVKILTMIGVHEMAESAPGEGLPKPPPSGPPSTPPKEEPLRRSPQDSTESFGPKAPEAPAEPEAPAAEPVVPDKETPVPMEDSIGHGEGPAPDWLKGTEVIEGEVEEPTPSTEPEAPAAEEPAPAPAPEEPTPPAEPEATPAPEAPAPKKPAPKPPSDEGPSEPPSAPPPPEPPATGGGGATPPTGETDAPASEKGPVPDWLKGV